MWTLWDLFSIGLLNCVRIDWLFCVWIVSCEFSLWRVLHFCTVVDTTISSCCGREGRIGQEEPPRTYYSRHFMEEIGVLLLATNKSDMEHEESDQNGKLKVHCVGNRYTSISRHVWICIQFSRISQLPLFHSMLKDAYWL